jgi:uncharacterized membrane protein YjfL (UPF0719 family)
MLESEKEFRSLWPQNIGHHVILERDFPQTLAWLFWGVKCFVFFLELLNKVTNNILKKESKANNLFVCFVLVVWGFQGLALTLRHSATWAIPLVLFALVILGIVLAFCMTDLDCNPPIAKFPRLLGWQAYATMTSFFLLRWGFTKFFLMVAWNLDLPDLSLPSS